MINEAKLGDFVPAIYVNQKLYLGKYQVHGPKADQSWQEEHNDIIDRFKLESEIDAATDTKFGFYNKKTKKFHEGLKAKGWDNWAISTDVHYHKDDTVEKHGRATTMKRIKQIFEDAPVNAAGSGNIAGIGVGPDGEPGVSKKAQGGILRRRKKEAEAQNGKVKQWRRKLIESSVKTGMFAGKQVFIVPSDLYYKVRLGKKKYGHYGKLLGTGPIGNAIREYGRHWKTKSQPIIVQDEKTGAMSFFKYGRQ